MGSALGAHKRMAGIIRANYSSARPKRGHEKMADRTPQPNEKTQEVLYVPTVPWLGVKFYMAEHVAVKEPYNHGLGEYFYIQHRILKNNRTDRTEGTSPLGERGFVRPISGRHAATIRTNRTRYISCAGGWKGRCGGPSCKGLSGLSREASSPSTHLVDHSPSLPWTGLRMSHTTFGCPAVPPSAEGCTFRRVARADSEDGGRVP
jgi:hypothetical protein